jgi:CBS domain containing-hemolysin-like protein
MALVHRTLWPIQKVLRRFTGAVENIFSDSENLHQRQIEELKLVLNSFAEDGELSKGESLVMSEVLDLSSVRIREIMTPRVDMVIAKKGDSKDKILQLAKESGHKIIPVCAESRDEVVEVIDAGRLFLDKECKSISKYTMPPAYISEYQRADAALKDFRTRKLKLAIVLDEYGGTIGILTLSDLLEEIFSTGSILNKSKEKNKGDIIPVKNLGDGKFLILGGVRINEIKEIFGEEIRQANVDTIGGLMACGLGHIPEEGESFNLCGVIFTINEVVNGRVLSVLLEIPDIENEDNKDNKEKDL